MATTATLASSGSAFAASTEASLATHTAGRYVVTLIAPPAASYSRAT